MIAFADPVFSEETAGFTPGSVRENQNTPIGKATVINTGVPVFEPSDD
jgi:hypothetical protein